MSQIEEHKCQLRRHFKAIRHGLGTGERGQIDAAIAAQVTRLSVWQEADVVLSYLSVGDEVDTRALICQAWAAGKTVAAPRVVDPRKMSWYCICSFENMQISKFHVEEPPANDAMLLNPAAELAAGRRVVALVPGLTFDAAGNRLGYGGGFYDTFLDEFHRLQGVSVGLCRACQLSPDLRAVGAIDTNDQIVAYVVTENSTMSYDGREPVFSRGKECIMPKTDIEIAQEAELWPVKKVAEGLGLTDDELIPYGHYMAKVDVTKLRDKPRRAKLVLVTAINPTPAGEGKTTTSVGLADALNRLGKNPVLALREPSLGPVFGIKGGAAGGGYAQVVPMENINLHFTGDFHAIGAANNLLAAMLDNHIKQGNELNIDPRRITWKRVVDMNDRQLRNVVDGLGGVANGVPRQDGFDITVASEIMAVFCLATSIADLKERLGRIVVGYTYDRQPVTAHDLKAEGAMAALLKDAISPNLVQTLEHTPAFVHGGPFANIAHGCNSVQATEAALKLGDYVVTEAGFGADLGAEKFCDIKCRMADLAPDACVIVATVRALKHNGGVAKADLGTENLEALEAGLPNLLRHVGNMRDVYGLPVVVAINAFPTDTPAELALVEAKCKELGVNVALSEVWAKGGEGGIALAKEVVRLCDEPSTFTPSYELGGIQETIETIAKRIYHADGVDFTPAAAKQMAQLESQGFTNMPVCMAKTQYSFTDDAKKLGAPEGFCITVRGVKVSAGAGFIVALTGDIMTMPGLPKKPAAENIDVDENGVITGLF